MTAGIDNLAQSLIDRLPLKVWLVLLVAVGVMSALLYAIDAYLLLDANPRLSEILFEVLGKYLVLVVALERAATVFIGIFRSHNRIHWTVRINRISEVLGQENAPTEVLRQAFKREHQVIEDIKDRTSDDAIDDVQEEEDDDYLGYLSAAKHTYEFQRARFYSSSKRDVALIVFVAGVVLAALGLSLFQDVFQQPSAPSAVQAGLLRLADIFITGGLLGGGSAGLNAVIAKVSEYTSKR